MQIQLGKTLDVAVVERELAQLWQQTTEERKADDDAVLRARVANLLVYVSTESSLREVDQMMADLTAVHPSRVLIMMGDTEGVDEDIDMSVDSFCQTDKRTGAKRLCGEEVTLKASGRFVSELPSAALPLVVSDLSTFLWWRGTIDSGDKVFRKLLDASDRLVIDSADFADPQRDLTEINALVNRAENKHVGISDINWARLTVWRALLADFYDVSDYRPWLETLESVRIDFVAPEFDKAAVAPQALLLAGWLASRLGWTIVDEGPLRSGDQLSFKFGADDDRVVRLTLNPVERAERKPGRLVQVELRSQRQPSASFVVERSADNRHILAEARLGPDVRRGRVLPVRNRSQAQLLSREMEIISNDVIYQQALAVAVTR